MQKTFSRATAPVLVIGLFFLLGLVSMYATNRVASGQAAIQLSAKLVGSDFKWVNNASGATNPTLMLKANTAQTIQIQNPTQTLHQLVIDLNGKQIATSGDIPSGGSGQVSFRPNMIGTLDIIAFIIQPR